MPTTSLDLLFAAPVKETGKTFTPSMEIAAILFLAERRRRKRSLFVAEPQKISFVSKLHYPLWASPWENDVLIADGLGFFSSTVTTQVLPDVRLFVDDVERGATVREQFRNTLEKHEKTFSDFAKTVEVQVDALIIEKELLSSVLEHVKETVSLESKQNSTATLLSPKLNLDAAVQSSQYVIQLHRQAQSDVAGLEYARNLLDEAMQLHEEMILREVEITRETFEAEIAKLRPPMERKIDQLLQERDIRLAKMNHIAEVRLRTKEKERERRERELQKLELGNADFVKKREVRRQKHDKTGVAYWERRIRDNEREIEQVKARIRAHTESIEETRRQNVTNAEKIRYGCQTLIEQERRGIIDLEAQRDKSVEAKKLEAETLELEANRIIAHIEGLTNKKRDEAEGLKRLAIPWQFDNVTLLCMPFYLACYQTGKKFRFEIFPPLRVLNSKGAVKALRKTLGSLRSVSDIGLSLQPRSKVMSRMLDFVLKEKIKSDKSFLETLTRVGTQSNILDRQNLKETLIQGAAELKAEGWITQKEAGFLVKAHS
jgi:hypothetical protein